MIKTEERRGGWSKEEGTGRGVMNGEKGGEKWREEERRKRVWGREKTS